MASKFNYYAIVGSNGYGICNNWMKCKKYSQKYFRKEIHKGFYTYEDAYIWIKEQFTRLYTNGNYEVISINDLREQELVFIKRGVKHELFQ